MKVKLYSKVKGDGKQFNLKVITFKSFAKPESKKNKSIKVLWLKLLKDQYLGKFNVFGSSFFKFFLIFNTL